MTEEDREIAALADLPAYAETGYTSHYALKLLQYMDKRGPLGGSSSLSFGVSLQHVFAFDRQLYDAAVNAPQDAIAAFDAILRRKFADLRELHGCFVDDFAAGHVGADELLLQQVDERAPVASYDFLGQWTRLPVLTGSVQLGGGSGSFST